MILLSKFTGCSAGILMNVFQLQGTWPWACVAEKRGHAKVSGLLLRYATNAALGLPAACHVFGSCICCSLCRYICCYVAAGIWHLGPHISPATTQRYTQ